MTTDCWVTLICFHEFSMEFRNLSPYRASVQAPSPNPEFSLNTVNVAILAQYIYSCRVLDAQKICMSEQIIIELIESKNLSM